MTSRDLPYLAKVGILAALYFAGGKLGLLLAVPQGNVTLAWPPTGIALSAPVGPYLLHSVVGFRVRLDRLRDVVGLVALAAMPSTTVSATIGVASLCLGGVVSWADYGALWWESGNV